MKTILRIKLIMSGLILSMLFTVSNAQIEWEKYDGNPVLTEFGASWAADGVSGPVVIYEDDVFKMWFSANGNIGYAESLDGITWIPNADPVILAGDPGDWDEEKNHPCVTRINDTLKMWYSGSSDGFLYETSIGYAWSLDNITWNVLADPVLEKGEPGSWEETGVYQPAIYYDGDTYKMWYNGFEGTELTDPDRVGYATSTNGINWIKDTIHNPVMDLGEEGTFFDTWIQSSSVLYLDDEYRMWISGWDNTTTSPMRYFRIGYATSPDGIEWTIQNDSLAVLDHGPLDSWDESRIVSPSVLIHEGQYKMWYAGFNYYTYRIGYATDSYVGISEENSQASVQLFCYPNPFSFQATIEYELKEKSDVELVIINSFGKEVDVLISEYQSSGMQQATWRTEGLPNGIYFVQLRAGKVVVTRKVVKMR